MDCDPCTHGARLPIIEKAERTWESDEYYSQVHVVLTMKALRPGAQESDGVRDSAL